MNKDLGFELSNHKSLLYKIYLMPTDRKPNHYFHAILKATGTILEMLAVSYACGQTEFKQEPCLTAIKRTKKCKHTRT